jgi:type 1 glutamine amidotransferase
MLWRVAAVLFIGGFSGTLATAAEPGTDSNQASPSQKLQRLLLIGAGPDGHPYSTHEFMAGVNLLAKLLAKAPSLQTIVVKAEGKWEEGPQLLDAADAAVLFVGQGAAWIQQDAARLQAFERLAARGGGLTTLHWGMGTKDPQYIEKFVNMFGGCHGGPDRKYKVVKVAAQPGDNQHPISRGIATFEVEDEFYYALKVPQRAGGIVPVIQVPIDGKNQTVGWAWERPGGGRSFGYSGCHFHRNWELSEYRRLVAQGVLWTLGRTIPKSGMNVDVSASDLTLPPPMTRKK